MTADLAQPAQMAWRSDDEPDELADATVIWAVLNVLDEIDVDAQDISIVRAARTAFLERLAELGLTQAELFENLANAIERGDWSAVGLPMTPD